MSALSSSFRLFAHAGLIAMLSLASGASAQTAPAAGASQTQQQAGNSAALPWVTIEHAMKQPIDTRVYISGRIQARLNPAAGSAQPYSLFVGDSTETVKVIIFQDVFSEIQTPEVFQTGSVVEIYGMVSEYRKQRQITVLKPTHIRLAPGTTPGLAAMRPQTTGAEPKFSSVNIGALTMQYIGTDVKVSGTVVEFVSNDDQPRVPTRVVVEDATGRVEVVYWSEVREGLSGDLAPAVGKKMSYSGKVTEYRGKLQLRVDKASNVQIAVPNQGSTARTRANENRQALRPESGGTKPAP